MKYLNADEDAEMPSCRDLKVVAHSSCFLLIVCAIPTKLEADYMLKFSWGCTPKRD